MLPRLEAEEQLRGIQAAVASNDRMLEDKDRVRLLDTLETQARGEARRRPPRATAEMLGRMGIGQRAEPGREAVSDA